MVIVSNIAFSEDTANSTLWYYFSILPVLGREPKQEALVLLSVKWWVLTLVHELQNIALIKWRVLHPSPFGGKAAVWEP